MLLSFQPCRLLLHRDAYEELEDLPKHISQALVADGGRSIPKGLLFFTYIDEDLNGLSAISTRSASSDLWSWKAECTHVVELLKEVSVFNPSFLGSRRGLPSCSRWEERCCRFPCSCSNRDSGREVVRLSRNLLCCRCLSCTRGQLAQCQ